MLFKELSNKFSHKELMDTISITPILDNFTKKMIVRLSNKRTNPKTADQLRQLKEGGFAHTLYKDIRQEVALEIIEHFTKKDIAVGGYYPSYNWSLFQERIVPNSKPIGLKYQIRLKSPEAYKAIYRAIYRALKSYKNDIPTNLVEGQRGDSEEDGTTLNNKVYINKVLDTQTDLLEEILSKEEYRLFFAHIRTVEKPKKADRLCKVLHSALHGVGRYEDIAKHCGLSLDSVKKAFQSIRAIYKDWEHKIQPQDNNKMTYGTKYRPMSYSHKFFTNVSFIGTRHIVKQDWRVWFVVVDNSANLTGIKGGHYFYGDTIKRYSKYDFPMFADEDKEAFKATNEEIQAIKALVAKAEKRMAKRVNHFANNGKADGTKEDGFISIGGHWYKIHTL